MNTDIRVDVGFLDHWKTDTLIATLGSDAVLSLMRIWIFAAQNKPDGRLTGVQKPVIERIAKWRGGEGELVDLLIELRFIEKDSDGVWSLHDWERHNPYAATAEFRHERAKKANAARRNKDDSKKNNDIDRCSANSALEARYEHAMSPPLPAPSPSPSPSASPSPTPSPSPIEVVAVADIATTPTHETAAAAVLDCRKVEYATPTQRASPVLSPESLEKIREIWNDKCRPYDISRLAPVKKWPPKRLAALQEFYENKLDSNIDSFGRLIDHLLSNPLMVGKTEPKPGYDRPWSMTLDWLLSPDNSTKVLEDF